MIKGENMLTFPDNLLRDPEFTRWVASAEGRVWMTLWGNISRNKNHNYEMYDKFYKNNKLATKISIIKLNKILGYKSNDKSNISKIINKLSKKKLIKKYAIENSNEPNIYEVGYIAEENKKEVPYAIEIFSIKIAEKAIKPIV